MIVLLPTIAISLLGRYYASYLEGIAPIDLTNFAAMRTVAKSILSSNQLGDSWSPMRDALEFLRSGSNAHLYETLFFQKTVRFQYPPTSLLPLELLSSMGLSSVGSLNRLNLLFYSLNAVAMGFLAWLLCRADHDDTRTAKFANLQLDCKALVPLSVIASLTFYPVLRAQVLGQIQVWIDLLFTLAIIFWVGGRQLVSGICIGLACAIKPQLGLLLVWGLLWRRVNFVLGISLTIAPILLISIARYGWQTHLDYLEVLSFLSMHGESFFANNSINGILNAYFSPNNPRVWDASTLTPYVPIVHAGTVLAEAFAVSLVVIPPFVFKSKSPSVETIGTAAICTVIGSPVAWEHHYGILLPLYLVAVRATFDLPPGRRRLVMLAALSVSWILVANLIPFVLLLGETPFRALQAHCFFGTLLLLIVLFALQAPLLRASKLQREPA